MGNQNKGILIIGQIPFQPGNMLGIQVVGRLVQQENVRFFQQKLAKQHLGTLTAAKVCDILVKSQVQKPQGSCHFLHLGVNHVKIVHGEQILNGAKLFHVGVHFFRRSFPHPVADFIHAGFHLK